MRATLAALLLAASGNLGAQTATNATTSSTNCEVEVRRALPVEVRRALPVENASTAGNRYKSLANADLSKIGPFPVITPSQPDNTLAREYVERARIESAQIEARFAERAACDAMEHQARDIASKVAEQIEADRPSVTTLRPVGPGVFSGDGYTVRDMGPLGISITRQSYP